MSIIKRRQNDNVYLYLQLTGKQFYLGMEDKIEPDRVYAALSYLRGKITAQREKGLKYYERVGQMLESLLPEEERRRLQEALQKEVNPTSIVSELDSLYLSAQRVFPSPTLKQLKNALKSMKKNLTKE